MTAARAARIGASRLRSAAIAAGTALFLLAAAGTTPLPAEEISVSLDPARTTIAFSLGATFHTVHGSFQLKSGALRFDIVSGAVRGEIAVDTQSGESGNATRDKAMRDEVLETRRFPTAVFRPDRFEGRLTAEGDSQGNLRGRLELHGAEHEILIPVSIHASAGKATGSARFEIPYVAWGLKNPSTLFLHVSDKVEIRIQTTADVSPERPAAAMSSAGRDAGSR